MVKRVVGGADNEAFDQRIAEWMMPRIALFQYGATSYGCIGLMSEVGTLCAGALFENYTGHDIHAHIAAERLTRHFLGECFRYCFENHGVDRITAPVVANNERGADFVEGLGFTLEGRMRRMAPDGNDTLIYGMLREECRWLKVGLKYGRSNPSFRGQATERAEHLRVCT